MTTQLLSTEAVWSHLKTDLWRFIRRRVQDDHTADDLLQEVFVRIHSRLDTLESTENLVAWVYRIARNLVNDHHRARRPSDACQLDSIPANDEASESFDRKAAGWLDQMIEQLPEKYRLAVRLSDVEGLSQEEVAKRIGLSLSGAKSRVQRGRVLLKGVLDQCCTFHRDQRGNVTDCDPKPDRTVCRECDA